MRLLALLLLTLCLFSTSCSKMILNKVSDGLSGGGSNFMMKDNDPEFVALALPLALKMYEGLIEANPEHVGLHGAAAAGFTGYAYAFIQFNADTLLEDHASQKHLYKRASNMYLRGRNYGLQGLETAYPGFKKSLRDTANPILSQTTKEDLDILYWTGMSWMGAFSTNKFNMSLALSLPQAKRILFRVAELDPDYGNGAIDEFLITFYGAMPSSMGGDSAKATEHFKRALILTDSASAGPYLAYAEALLIPRQDLATFKQTMKTIIKIKPEADENNLLLRTLQKKKAQWYLRHIEDFFLLSDQPTETAIETTPQQASSLVSPQESNSLATGASNENN